MEAMRWEAFAQRAEQAAREGHETVSFTPEEMDWLVPGWRILQRTEGVFRFWDMPVVIRPVETPIAAEE